MLTVRALLLVVLPAMAVLANPPCTPSLTIGECYQGKGALIHSLTLDKLNLSYSELERSQFQHVKFDSLIIRDANMSLSRLRNFKSNFSRWDNIDLHGASINYMILKNFVFDKSSFVAAKITHSRFEDGDFSQTSFKDAYITDSSFVNCWLPKNFQQQAILINVKITNCKYHD